MSSIITVEHVGKKYLLQHQLSQQPYVALRDVITDEVKNLGRKLMSPFRSSPLAQSLSHEDFWALQDVSFEVNEGDRIGIIGRNGAGKSTLLKILSRITEPTTGMVRIKGRVASLLEVGTGFHPELTGRENIFLNGAILGMSRTEIRKKFDEIVDFAEIEKFLDTPVKRYSSGMYVRLAFAVAAHLEPEILIIDEVLAVGDAQFQKKCLGKMEDVSSREGRTVLFVSHNMAAVRSLCTKGILMEKGECIFYGNSFDAVDNYLKPKLIPENITNLRDMPRALNTQGVRIVDMSVFNLTRKIFNEAETLDDLLITVLYDVQKPIKFIAIEWFIRDSRGVPIAFSSSSPMDNYIFRPNLGENKAECNIPGIPLSIGRYTLDIGITIPNIECIDYVENAASFIITECDPYKSGSQYKSERAPVFLYAAWNANNMLSINELT